MVTPNNQEGKEEAELAAIATAAETTTTTNGNNDSNNEKKKKKKKKNQNNSKNQQVGIHGVRLKRFELVVAKLLSSVEPHYVHLPPPIPILSTTYNANDNDNDNNNDDNDDWPFSSLPRSARVVGNNHPNLKRAQRKEGQLKSMLQCILRLIPPPNNSTNTTNSTSSTNSTNSTSSNTTTDDCCSCDEKNPVGAATTKTTTKITTIVDFGGGSGHLGIPLALLLPNCRIVVVDLNRRSIDLLHDKAASVIKEIESETDPERQKLYTTDFITTSSTSLFHENERYNNTNNPLIRCCGGSTCSDGDDSDSDGRIRILDNLYTFCGPVQYFVEPFDMAIALHLCGEATDVCLRKAINAEAASIIVAPCCVGKLSKKVLNPDVYHATGQNNATVTYPQSDLFCRLISPTTTTTTTKDDNNDNSNKQEEEDWNALAKAADYSNENEFGTSRNASRRTAKALLETDRMLFLENNMYKTALMKMQPLNVTPKNDILVAWRPQVYDDTTAKRKRSPNNTVNIQELFSTPDIECKADIEVTKSHLLLLPVDNNDSNATCTTAITTNSTSPQKVVDRNDWTNDEEEEIKRTILEFLNRDDNDDSTDEVMVFPTRMGGRKRKLIHFVAGKLNVAHWNKGKKHSEKTVAIARRGTTEIK